MQASMPRRPLFRTSDFPYHVTARSNNRDFFYLPMAQVWSIFVGQLKEVESQFGVVVHVFVLMSNHYHLILHTPRENLSEAIRYLQTEVAREINWHAGRMNHVFGARYKWSVIGTESYYWVVIKYVLRNPMEAGISERIQDYPFVYSQSCNPQLTHKGMRSLGTFDFFRSRSDIVEIDPKWVNTPFGLGQSEGIRRGLRRKWFHPGRTPGAFSLMRQLDRDALRLRKGTGT